MIIYKVKIRVFLLLAMICSYSLSAQNSNYILNRTIESATIENENDIIDRLTIEELDEYYAIKFIEEKVGASGTKHKFYQVFFKNIPIENSFVVFHYKNNNLMSYTGKIVKDVIGFDEKSIVKTPSISSSVKNRITQELETTLDENIVFELISNDLIISNVKTKKYLPVFKMEVATKKPIGRYVVYQNAVSGEIVNIFNNLQDVTSSCNTLYHGVQDINFDQNGSSYELQYNNGTKHIETHLNSLSTPVPSSTSATNCFNLTGNDLVAIDVHWATETTYDYFFNFGINSYDNAGAAVVSVVNETGLSDNAYWNGSELHYGSSGGSFPGPITTLDVVAHEYGHAITQYRGNLLYQGESGAINEALSDMIAASVELFSINNNANYPVVANHWIAGDLNGNGVRDMSNPSAFGDPDIYGGTNWINPNSPIDNGGVHTNSGIGNHWFYLLVDGGANNSYTVNSLGIDIPFAIIMETYFYLSGNVTPTYQEYRDASINASIDLYNDCFITDQVIAAWNAVGVYGTQTCPTAPPITDFSTDLQFACVNQNIQFNDESIGSNITDWLWDFGDGNTSTLQNPTHQYLIAGTYNVSLTTTNMYGNAVETKTAYINIGVPSATISGTSTIVNSGSTYLQFDFTGTPPFDFIYTDGSSNFPVNGVVANSHLIQVAPSASTTYTLVSMSDAGCNGLVNGQADITISNITNFIGGVVNEYAEVINIVSTCDSSVISVANNLFSVGDKVMIIQMKGANVNLTSTDGDHYGEITAINNAGNYEFGIVNQIIGNNVILEDPLQRSYTVAGKVQLIKVLTGTNYAVTSTLTALPWNGVIGGVLVVDISGKLLLNSDINLSGLGFRGGKNNGGVSGSSDCDVVNLDNALGSFNRMAFKGEGCSLFTPTVNDRGRGGFANGGGGGNPHNIGGAGGGSFGAGGNSSTAQWGGCTNLVSVPSIKGYGLSNQILNKKLFLGGGGGAGNNNSGSTTALSYGGNGGGLIILRADELIASSNSIISNGEDGESGDPAGLGFEGSGGGGAAGALVLDIPNIYSNVSVELKGGAGGSAPAGSPGGGGSGGALLSTSNMNNISANLSGGASGGIGNNSQGTAETGEDGGQITNYILPEIIAADSLSFEIDILKFSTCLDSCNGAIELNIENMASSTPFTYIIDGINTSYYQTGNIVDSLFFIDLCGDDYHVSVTNAKGCTITDTFTIAIDSCCGAYIDIAFSDTFVCVGESISITNNSVYTQNTIHSWIFNGGTPSFFNGSTPPPIYFNSAGDYLIEYIVMDSCRTDTFLQKVIVNSPAPAHNSLYLFCTSVPSNFQIGAYPLLNYSYSWSPSDHLNNPNIANPITTVDTSIQYVLSYTDLNTTCSNYDTVDILIDTMPSTFIEADKLSACIGDTFVLNTTFASDSVLWNGTFLSDTLILNLHSDTIIWAEAFLNECGSFDTIFLSVDTIPDINILSNDTSICFGENIDLSANSAFPIEWNTTETTNAINVSPVSDTIYIATVTNGACTNADSVLVVVNDLPNINITNLDTGVCIGASIILTVNSDSPFSWSTGETINTISVNPLVDTFYYVESLNLNCYRADTVEVLVDTIPDINILSNDTSICFGENIDLSANSAFSIEWNTTETTNTISVSPTNDTIYFAIGINGFCTNRDSVSVVVNQLPNINIIGLDTVCINTVVELTATGSPSSSYSWINADNPTGITNFVRVNSDTTVYLENGDNCISGDSLMISAIDSNWIEIVGEDTICEGEGIVLSVLSNTSYEWSSGEQNQSLILNLDTNTVFSVSTSSNYCPIAVDTFAVYVYPYPTLSTNGPITANQGQLIDLEVYGADNYLWDYAVELSCLNCPNPSLIANQDDVFFVTGSNEFCSALDSIEIFVSLIGDCIAVPSGFSPNKDLVNDTFYPILMNLDVQISAFRIYNRWGENIHNETRAWDGMYGGKAQEVGVYVYYLEYTCNGRNETRSGNVTLIR